MPYIHRVFKKLRLNALSYVHPSSGHSPLPKKYEIDVIHKIFNNSSIESCYKDFDVKIDKLNKD